jgi:hypothetical protein
MDALAIGGGLGVLPKRDKKKKEGFQDSGGDEVIAGVFVLLWVVISLAIWITAIVMAARCANAALNVLVAIFFPLIFIIVRLLVPCVKAA